jgi:very-short-patch-repair endonuclease
VGEVSPQGDGRGKTGGKTMKRTKSQRLDNYAVDLRKTMTAEERKLWYLFLKDLPVRFRRQKQIGKYIADFYCAEKKLVIELDGTQHYDGQEEYDEKRNLFMELQGLTVLHYSNADVNLRFKEICEDIWNYVM